MNAEFEHAKSQCVIKKTKIAVDKEPASYFIKMYLFRHVSNVVPWMSVETLLEPLLI